MKYLKCGLSELNDIFDTQCFHILCCNYYYAFYGNVFFVRTCFDFFITNKFLRYC